MLLQGSVGYLRKGTHYPEVSAYSVMPTYHRASLESAGKPYYSDEFRRLFWEIYVYESDFASELSPTPPSGIARFEDLVPYPTSQPPSVDENDNSMDSTMELLPPQSKQHQDLAAFQISANPAI